MRVVFVPSNWSYPGQEGLHLQSAAVLKSLLDQIDELHIVTVERHAGQVDADRLQADWGDKVKVETIVLPFNYPILLLINLLVPRFLNPIHRHLTGVIGRVKPDLVHVEGIVMGPLLPAIARVAPVLMSEVDAWSLRQERLAERATGLKRLFHRGYAAVSRWVEARHFARARAVHVVSPEDGAYLQAHVKAPVSVVPVGLPGMPEPASPSAAQVPAAAPRLVFWGDLQAGYLREGLFWLLTQVLPLLPEPLRACLHIDVLGRRVPDDELRQVAGRSVTFHQWVQDVDQALASASVVVLPDASGSGMKNRTLHAMACGVPVVGTRFAFEGIHARNNVECLIRDDAPAFAEALRCLLCDDTFARRMGQAGRQMVLDRYSMSAVVGGWRDLYQSCLKGANR